jgi:hypothetical protein
MVRAGVARFRVFAAAAHADGMNVASRRVLQSGAPHSSAESGVAMIRMAALVWLLGLAFATSAQAADEDTREPYACALRPDLAGPCFELRGRLSFWNGAPSARIWPVGTKRLLGVHFDVLPPALEAEMTRFDPQGRFDTEVWAHFRLCPFTRSRAGHMQFVCIEAWRGASFRRRKE